MPAIGLCTIRRISKSSTTVIRITAAGTNHSTTARPWRRSSSTDASEYVTTTAPHTRPSRLAGTPIRWISLTGSADTTSSRFIASRASASQSFPSADEVLATTVGWSFSTVTTRMARMDGNAYVNSRRLSARSSRFDGSSPTSMSSATACPVERAMSTRSAVMLVSNTRSSQYPAAPMTMVSTRATSKGRRTLNDTSKFATLGRECRCAAGWSVAGGVM